MITIPDPPEDPLPPPPKPLLEGPADEDPPCPPWA